MQPKQWLPLTEEYKPSKLMFRDKQLQQLIKCATHPAPTNAYLQGGRGFGKTLTTKFFEDEVTARGLGNVFRIQWDSSRKEALRQTSLDYGLAIPAYRLGAFALAREFAERTAPEGVIAVVIDEPEKAFNMREVASFIHSFHNIMVNSLHRRFSIIIASRMIYPWFRKNLPDDTLSRFGIVEPTFFAPYNAPQIVEILKQRLDIMFDDKPYRKHSLTILAQHIRRIGGDMRQGIKILYHAVEEAQNHLSADMIREAVEWGKNKWWENEIRNLSFHQALLLCSAATGCADNGGNKTMSKSAIQKYEEWCVSLGEQPVAVRTARYHFYELEKKAFLTTGPGGVGRSREMYVMFKDKNELRHIVQASQNIKWREEKDNFG